MGPRWAAWEGCERPLRDVPAAGVRSPAPRRRAWSPSTWPAREPACWCASRARWRADAWTCTTPITSVHGGGCARSPASGRGRSRCWRCTVRAATTSCRPGTSACSSTWGAVSAGAIRGQSGRRGGPGVLRALWDLAGPGGRARRCDLEKLRSSLRYQSDTRSKVRYQNVGSIQAQGGAFWGYEWVKSARSTIGANVGQARAMPCARIRAGSCRALLASS